MRALLPFLTTVALAAGQWTYANSFEWRTIPGYSTCGGKQQSPIALEAGAAESGSPGFWKLWVPRATPSALELSNTGNAIMLDVEDRGITLTSSALQAQYVLRHMTWHVPSEHVIEGKRYPMERQLVFAPADYRALQALGITSYPVAIVSELYSIGEESDDTTARVSQELSKIQEAGQSTRMRFFPTFDFQTDSFFTYTGSLTTPPCTEHVQWHVSSRIHSATLTQITRMRDVIGRMSSSAAPLGVPVSAPDGWQVYAGNARPIQPLHSRCLVGADPLSNCTTPVRIRSFRGNL